MNQMLGLALDLLRHTLPLMESLSSNAANATPGQLGAVGSLLASAMWGSTQNFIPLTPSTVAGPGIIDSSQYLHSIATAGSPEAANRTAAEGLYGLLLPGMDEKMAPLIKSMLEMGKK